MAEPSRGHRVCDEAVEDDIEVVNLVIRELEIALRSLICKGSSGPTEYMQSVLHNLGIDILSTCRQIPQKFKLFGRPILRFKSSTSELFLMFSDFRAWAGYWLIMK